MPTDRTRRRNLLISLGEEFGIDAEDYDDDIWDGPGIAERKKEISAQFP